MAPKTAQRFRAPKVINKQAQETAQSVQSAPKTNSQTETQAATRSNAVMRKMVEGVIGTITYLRELLPDAAMQNINFDEVLPDESLDSSQSQDGTFTVSGIAREKSDEGAEICRGIDGALEALEKGFLERMEFTIYVDPENPKNIVEAWIMTFNYTPDGCPIMGLETTVGQLALSDSSPDSWSPAKAKKMMKKIVTRLYACKDNLRSLPSRKYIDLQLFFNDTCPAEYMPPAFEDSTGMLLPYMTTMSTDETPLVGDLGTADSGRHSLSLRVATIVEVLPAPEEPITKEEEREKPGRRAYQLQKEQQAQLQDADKRIIVWDPNDHNMQHAIGEIDDIGRIEYKLIPVHDPDIADDPFGRGHANKLVGKHDSRSGDLRLQAQPAILARRHPDDEMNGEETIPVGREAVHAHAHRAMSMFVAGGDSIRGDGDGDVPMELEETQVSLPPQRGPKRYPTHSDMNVGDHTSDETPPTSSNDDGHGDLSSSSPGGSTPEEAAYNPKKRKTAAMGSSSARANSKPKPKAKATGPKASTVTLAKKAPAKKKKATAAPKARASSGSTGTKKAAPKKKAAAESSTAAGRSTKSKAPKTAAPRKAANNPLVARERPKAKPQSESRTLSDPQSEATSSSGSAGTNEDDESGGANTSEDGVSGEAVGPSDAHGASEKAGDGSGGAVGHSCFCKLQPNDPDLFEVRCNTCNKKLHGVCNGMPDRARAPDIFHCIPCRREAEHGEATEEEMDAMLGKLSGLCLYRMIVISLRGAKEVPAARKIALYIGCKTVDVEATFEKLLRDGFIAPEHSSPRGKKKATTYRYVNDASSKTRFSHLFNPGGGLEHEAFGTPLTSMDKYVGGFTEETLPPSQSQIGFPDIFPSSQSLSIQRHSQSQSQSQSHVPVRGQPKAAGAPPTIPPSEPRESAILIPSSEPSSAASAASRKRKPDTPLSSPQKRGSNTTKPQKSARMMSNVCAVRWMD